MQGDHALQFAALSSAVLRIEPDGIEARGGGVGRQDGRRLVKARDACSFALAKTGTEEGGTHEAEIRCDLYGIGRGHDNPRIHVI